MVVKADRRHILLGRFPVPLSTLSTRVTHDVVVPLGRSLAPRKAKSGLTQTPALAGQCLLGPKKRVAFGLGHLGPGDWKNSRAALVPFRICSPEPGSEPRRL